MILSIDKNWACLKNLNMLKPNFEEADGLGIMHRDASRDHWIRPYMYYRLISE